MKHLMIVEPTAGGHRMHYVRHVLMGAIARGVKVSIATWPESLDHPSFKQFAVTHEGRFEVVLLLRSRMSDKLLKESTGFRQQTAFHRTFSDCYAAIPVAKRPSHVFVPYLNMIDKVVPLLGSPFGNTPWSGIVMRDTFHHESVGILGPRRRSDWLKRFLFLGLLRNPTLRRLFTIDPALPEWLAKAQPQLVARLVWLPEPVLMKGEISKAEVRERLGIHGSSKVLLVYGVIDARKQLHAAINAMLAPACPANVILLVAGPQSEEVKVQLQNAPGVDLINAGRIVQLNSYLTTREEFEVFRASDIVWLGYREHYTMSAVLIQAAAMGLPVIACQEGLIGWITRNESLGCSVDVSDNVNVSEAIRNLCEQAELVSNYSTRGPKLAERHHPEEFAARVLDGTFLQDLDRPPVR